MRQIQTVNLPNYGLYYIRQSMDYSDYLRSTLHCSLLCLIKIYFLKYWQTIVIIALIVDKYALVQV